MEVEKPTRTYHTEPITPEPITAVSIASKNSLILECTVGRFMIEKQHSALGSLSVDTILYTLILLGDSGLASNELA